ncbi:opioid growth factor receptor-related protein [Comamonadaceae bacterium G21597-S1]|nr:opioid growth factor receptor-related protein [Comamonadaceae bacterium G21597-S1]
MNKLLAFYYGSHPDSHGRMLAEILKQDDHWLEVCHNYIQWLFPTKEYSHVTPDAPTLDKETVDAFKSDELLRNHLRAALIRILSFYGLKLTVGGIVKGPNWAERKLNWFTENTHNSLRITRILKCLNALDLNIEAKAFQSALLALCRSEPDCGIDKTALKYWSEALPHQ